MMLSKKTKYALKALHYLAEQPGDQPVLIADLARAENIPKKFLEFILLSLRKGGILQSRVGKGGGYSLAQPANRITIGAVINILEGNIAPVQCLDTTNQAHCEECLDEKTCGIRLVMTDVNIALSQVLNNLTLTDMVERAEAARNKQQNIVDFSI